MKDVFIVNPKSGKNSQYELIQEVKEHFQGKRIIIEKTKGPEHATFIAKKYALLLLVLIHIDCFSLI